MVAADNDNQVIWRGVNIAGLPVSASAAREVGATYYYTGRLCKRGHISPRYTGGACIDCFLDKRHKHPWSNQAPTWGKTLNKLAREAARFRGDTHYTPSRPCKHGHSRRWVSTNNCVDCDAELRDERREKIRDSYLLKKYGITQEQRDELADSQGWLCPICSDRLGVGLAMHVDHCHSTGNVRGVLCSRCNQAIGLLKDNPEIMRRAAKYVEISRIAA